MHRAYHPTPAKSKQPFRWLALLPWLAVAYAATGFYTVKPNERAVVRRCGRALPDLRLPGLHFGFPYGIDSVTRIRVFEHKRIGVGVTLTERSVGRLAEPARAECLTGDRNLIVLSAVVQYRIADPEAYLFSITDVPGLVGNVTSGELASVVSSMKVDDVLTVQRIAIQNEVMRSTQAKLNRYAAGVEVTSVSLEEVAAPQEVSDAFRDVTAAREDRQRAVNEAQGYANRLLPQARGEAQRALLEAEAYRTQVVEAAGGDADRFKRIQAKLADNRRLTVLRLILETMERVLPRLNKIVLDDDPGGVDLGIIEANE